MFRIGEGVSQIETCVVRREMLFSSFTCSGRKFAEVEHLSVTQGKTKISNFQNSTRQPGSFAPCSRCTGSAGRSHKLRLCEVLPVIGPPLSSRRTIRQPQAAASESSSKTRQLEHPTHHTPNFFLLSFPHTAKPAQRHSQLIFHSLACWKQFDQFLLLCAQLAFSQLGPAVHTALW